MNEDFYFEMYPFGGGEEQKRTCRLLHVRYIKDIDLRGKQCEKKEITSLEKEVQKTKGNEKKNKFLMYKPTSNLWLKVFSLAFFFLLFLPSTSSNEESQGDRVTDYKRNTNIGLKFTKPRANEEFPLESNSILTDPDNPLNSSTASTTASILFQIDATSFNFSSLRFPPAVVRQISKYNVDVETKRADMGERNGTVELADLSDEDDNVDTSFYAWKTLFDQYEVETSKLFASYNDSPIDSTYSTSPQDESFTLIQDLFREGRSQICVSLYQRRETSEPLTFCFEACPPPFLYEHTVHDLLPGVYTAQVYAVILATGRNGESFYYKFKGYWEDNVYYTRASSQANEKKEINDDFEDLVVLMDEVSFVIGKDTWRDQYIRPSTVFPVHSVSSLTDKYLDLDHCSGDVLCDKIPEDPIKTQFNRRNSEIDFKDIYYDITKVFRSASDSWLSLLTPTYESLHKDQPLKDALRKIAEPSTNTVLVLMANKGHLELLKNTLFFLALTSHLHIHTVVFSLQSDEESTGSSLCDAISDLPFHPGLCVDIPVSDEYKIYLQGTKDVLTRDFSYVAVMKPLILSAVIAANVNALWLDTDIVVFKNPLDYLKGIANHGDFRNQEDRRGQHDEGDINRKLSERSDEEGCCEQKENKEVKYKPFKNTCNHIRSADGNGCGKEMDLIIQAGGHYATEAPLTAFGQYRSEVCTGFYWIRSSQKMISFLVEIIIELVINAPKKSFYGDQLATNQVLDDAQFRHSTINNISYHVLDPLLFPNGIIFFGSELLDNLECEMPYIVHNNYLIGWSKKKERFREHNLWYEDYLPRLKEKENSSTWRTSNVASNGDLIFDFLDLPTFSITWSK